ncbi:MAG: glycosyltransferase [Desulfobacteraceae bacterium]|nr:glycosyltransferase [Desulfobacteraceae bacterium]
MMTAGLKHALAESGHHAEIVFFPFNFSSVDHIAQLMDYCSTQNFETVNGYLVDKLLVLQFPVYYVNHPDKTLWLMHQHRPAYDLYDPVCASKALAALRKKIVDQDTRELKNLPAVYTMCRNISHRLHRFNQIASRPLYHPPAHEDRFYCDAPYDVIFFPSRLETLKRQDLLVRAMAHTRSPVTAVIAGEGGGRQHLQALVRQLNLSRKVCLAGHITEEEKYTLYARSLGVFFGPRDEDYGYITLEAMLSSKPVITCTDSGGPLEFVKDGETGFVVEPDPERIAQKIDWLHANKNKAKEMGQAGRQAYQEKNINWNSVVDTLLHR